MNFKQNRAPPVNFNNLKYSTGQHGSKINSLSRHHNSNSPYFSWDMELSSFQPDIDDIYDQETQEPYSIYSMIVQTTAIFFQKPSNRLVLGIGLTMLALPSFLLHIYSKVLYLLLFQITIWTILCSISILKNITIFEAFKTIQKTPANIIYMLHCTTRPDPSSSANVSKSEYKSLLNASCKSENTLISPNAEYITKMFADPTGDVQKQITLPIQDIENEYQRVLEKNNLAENMLQRDMFVRNLSQMQLFLTTNQGYNTLSKKDMLYDTANRIIMGNTKQQHSKPTTAISSLQHINSLSFYFEQNLKIQQTTNDAIDRGIVINESLFQGIELPADVLNKQELNDNTVYVEASFYQNIPSQFESTWKTSDYSNLLPSKWQRKGRTSDTLPPDTQRENTTERTGLLSTLSSFIFTFHNTLLKSQFSENKSNQDISRNSVLNNRRESHKSFQPYAPFSIPAHAGQKSIFSSNSDPISHPLLTSSGRFDETSTMSRSTTTIYMIFHSFSTSHLKRILNKLTKSTENVREHENPPNNLDISQILYEKLSIEQQDSFLQYITELSSKCSSSDYHIVEKSIALSCSAVDTSCLYPFTIQHSENVHFISIEVIRSTPCSNYSTQQFSEMQHMTSKTLSFDIYATFLSSSFVRNLYSFTTFLSKFRSHITLLQRSTIRHVINSSYLIQDFIEKNADSNDILSLISNPRRGVFLLEGVIDEVSHRDYNIKHIFQVLLIYYKTLHYFALCASNNHGPNPSISFHTFQSLNVSNSLLKDNSSFLLDKDWPQSPPSSLTKINIHAYKMNDITTSLLHTIFSNSTVSIFYCFSPLFNYTHPTPFTSQLEFDACLKYILSQIFLLSQQSIYFRYQHQLLQDASSLQRYFLSCIPQDEIKKLQDFASSKISTMCKCPNYKDLPQSQSNNEDATFHFALSSFNSDKASSPSIPNDSGISIEQQYKTISMLESTHMLLSTQQLSQLTLIPLPILTDINIPAYLESCPQRYIIKNASSSALNFETLFAKLLHNPSSTALSNINVFLEQELHIKLDYSKQDIFKYLSPYITVLHELLYILKHKLHTKNTMSPLHYLQQPITNMYSIFTREIAKLSIQVSGKQCYNLHEKLETTTSELNKKFKDSNLITPSLPIALASSIEIQAINGYDFLLIQWLQDRNRQLCQLISFHNSNIHQYLYHQLTSTDSFAEQSPLSLHQSLDLTMYIKCLLDTNFFSNIFERLYSLPILTAIYDKILSQYTFKILQSKCNLLIYSSYIHDPLYNQIRTPGQESSSETTDQISRKKLFREILEIILHKELKNKNNFSFDATQFPNHQACTTDNNANKNDVFAILTIANIQLHWTSQINQIRSTIQQLLYQLDASIHSSYQKNTSSDMILTRNLANSSSADNTDILQSSFLFPKSPTTTESSKELDNLEQTSLRLSFSSIEDIYIMDSDYISTTEPSIELDSTLLHSLHFLLSSFNMGNFSTSQHPLSKTQNIPSVKDESSNSTTQFDTAEKQYENLTYSTNISKLLSNPQFISTLNMYGETFYTSSKTSLNYFQKMSEKTSKAKTQKSLDVQHKKQRLLSVEPILLSSFYDSLQQSSSLSIPFLYRILQELHVQISTVMSCFPLLLFFLLIPQKFSPMWLEESINPSIEPKKIDDEILSFFLEYMTNLLKIKSSSISSIATNHRKKQYSGRLESSFLASPDFGFFSICNSTIPGFQNTYQNHLLRIADMFCSLFQTDYSLLLEKSKDNSKIDLSHNSAAIASGNPYLFSSLSKTYAKLKDVLINYLEFTTFSDSEPKLSSCRILMDISPDLRRFSLPSLYITENVDRTLTYSPNFISILTSYQIAKGTLPSLCDNINCKDTPDFTFQFGDLMKRPTKEALFHMTSFPAYLSILTSCQQLSLQNVAQYIKSILYLESKASSINAADPMIQHPTELCRCEHHLKIIRVLNEKSMLSFQQNNTISHYYSSLLPDASGTNRNENKHQDKSNTEILSFSFSTSSIYRLLFMSILGVADSSSMPITPSLNQTFNDANQLSQNPIKNNPQQNTTTSSLVRNVDNNNSNSLNHSFPRYSHKSDDNLIKAQYENSTILPDVSDFEQFHLLNGDNSSVAEKSTTVNNSNHASPNSLKNINSLNTNISFIDDSSQKEEIAQTTIPKQSSISFANENNAESSFSVLSTPKHISFLEKTYQHIPLRTVPTPFPSKITLTSREYVPNTNKSSQLPSTTKQSSIPKIYKAHLPSLPSEIHKIQEPRVTRKRHSIDYIDKQSRCFTVIQLVDEQALEAEHLTKIIVLITKDHFCIIVVEILLLKLGMPYYLCRLRNLHRNDKRVTNKFIRTSHNI